MASNKFNVKYDTPDIISWAQKVNERNDAKAKGSRDNMMNLLKMAGLAAAMKGNNTGVNQYEAAARDDLNKFETSLGMNFGSYSPEDKLALINLGYKPSLFGNKDWLNSNDESWASNVWSD